MIERMQYVCERCGLSFDDRADCIKHEATHVKPYLILQDGMIYPPRQYGDRARNYPEYMRVQFEDDAVFVYKMYREAGRENGGAESCV